MKQYIIYELKDNHNVCIVELLNDCDMYNVQKELIEKGYIIRETIFDKFIRCKKVSEEK